MTRLLAWAILATSTAAWGQAAPPPPGTTVVDTPGSHAAAQEASPLSQAEEDIAAQNFEAARGLLDAYLSVHPDSARALFDRGYVDEAQGQQEKAAGYYQRSIAADPKLFEPRLALGLIRARKGDRAGAGEELTAATSLEPNPPNPEAKAQAWRALAELKRQSDPAAARQALLAALKLTPETVDDTLLTAEIAEASGDANTAEAAYRKVLAQQPQSSAAVAGLAHLLIQQRKFAEAEPLLKNALTRDPDNPALTAQLAALLGDEGRTAEAVTALEKLHQADPADDQVTGMLADTYTQNGEAAKADSLYAQLLAQHPDDAALLAARGENLIRQARYGEALPVLDRAVKADPANSNAWSSLAFAASQTHHFQLTLEALAARQNYLPETPATYFLQATAYDNLHQTKQAAEYYHKFLDAAGSQFPDQVWQAKHRLLALGK